MYTKILVPLDGSRLSECVLPYARTLAKALKLPVELLQAVDPDTVRALCNPAKGWYFDTVESEMSRNSVAYLQGVANSFLDAPSVECFAEAGEPARVILDKAASDPNVLITMATRGYSGVQRWLLGSVADQVLHGASNPLLLVREENEGKTTGEARLERVVVALDGSKMAELVLPHVKTLAKGMKLEAILLQVYAPPTQGYAAAIYSTTMHRIADEMKEEAKAYLETRVSEFRSDGVDRVSCVVLEGNAASEIIDFAHRTAFSLVAMTTHGHTGVSRRLLGSIAARVIRHSGDPVVVIRGVGAQ
jgi:nucleotide-binding universal stress UspA family protein